MRIIAMILTSLCLLLSCACGSSPESQELVKLRAEVDRFTNALEAGRYREVVEIGKHELPRALNAFGPYSSSANTPAAREAQAIREELVGVIEQHYGALEEQAIADSSYEIYFMDVFKSLQEEQLRKRWFDDSGDRSHLRRTRSEEAERRAMGLALDEAVRQRDELVSGIALSVSGTDVLTDRIRADLERRSGLPVVVIEDGHEPFRHLALIDVEVRIDLTSVGYGSGVEAQVNQVPVSAALQATVFGHPQDLPFSEVGSVTAEESAPDEITSHQLRSTARANLQGLIAQLRSRLAQAIPLPPKASVQAASELRQEREYAEPTEWIALDRDTRYNVPTGTRTLSERSGSAGSQVAAAGLAVGGNQITERVVAHLRRLAGDVLILAPEQAEALNMPGDPRGRLSLRTDVVVTDYGRDHGGMMRSVSAALPVSARVHIAVTGGDDLSWSGIDQRYRAEHQPPETIDASNIGAEAHRAAAALAGELSRAIEVDFLELK